MSTPKGRIELYTTIMASVFLAYFLKTPVEHYNSMLFLAVGGILALVLLYQFVLSLGGLNINGVQFVKKRESRNHPLVIVLLMLAVIVPANDHYPFGDWSYETRLLGRNVKKILLQLDSPETIEASSEVVPVEIHSEEEEEKEELELESDLELEEVSRAETTERFPKSSIPEHYDFSHVDRKNCWDYNANGACDFGEDIDGSGYCDGLDCKS